MSQPKRYKPSVREHYEQYPYPQRTPEDEKGRLVTTLTDYLDMINYYCFGGAKHFDQDYRVLIAGGGTGDSTIFQAEQLQAYGGRLVYLDLSATSLKIAKERARIRGLNNIEWIHGSLLNLPDMGLESFDYINCSGVLHHLPDPDAGIAALASVLKENGAMGLMLYGAYGRQTIYPVQELMRYINKDEDDMSKKVENVKHMFSIFPKSNLFTVTGHEFAADIKGMGDVGIYDLLLHSQDRAYTVPQLYKFVERVGLHLRKFVASHQVAGNAVYDPFVYIREPSLVAQLHKLSHMEREAVAELLVGNIKKHSIFASKQEAPIPSIDNESFILFFSTYYTGWKAACDKNKIPIQTTKPDNVVEIALGGSGEKISLRPTPTLLMLLEGIDGKKDIKTLLDEVQRKSGVDRLLIKKELSQLFFGFNNYHCMYLRAPGTQTSPSLSSLQERVTKMYQKQKSPVAA